ncbi:hypothetical protein BDW59DRAFT_141591 [Aspergillus cavernicola]|uniref:GPI-anchored cell surface glycoprotein n=1 Tax=Aspergillus cavernicola TaxID=176166 RepID=A0ABR4IRW0_9EURO
MSLNGLDNPTVIESYQIALAEAGGWFLLRYVSRDEVTLHGRGTGGVPDVRNAIESYEECSPLYGFLQYRRRKVVLSYLPEDLSRLIRARTTVQFQSILDKFSPHDTIFSLSKPLELTESALSSACLLHTASSSITSSSSSLRRRRLMEIAEDAEETPTNDTERNQNPAQDARHRSFSQVSEATIVPPSVVSNAPKLSNGDGFIPTSPVDVQVNGRAPSISGDQYSERPTSSRNFRDDLSLAPSESRQSTQSARPSLRDLERATGYKPKVKLGPRPSVDGSGRPRTAGNLTRAAEQRPVASLPAGIRASPFRKSIPTPARPRSQGNPVATPSARVPPVPPLLVPPSSMQISRPQLSPGAKSLSALSTSTTSNEKERLMKALQMRKSQMQKRAQEVKRTQPSSERQSNATEDLNDDKENVKQLPEKVKYDRGRQRLSSISENDKAPLSETQPENQQPPLAPEPGPVHSQEEQSPLESPKAEPGVDMVDDPCNYILPRTTYDPTASEPNDLDNPLEEAQIPLSEPEIDSIEEDPVGCAGSEIKCGPGSPSAGADVPPEDGPRKAPEEEIVTPLPQTEEPLVPIESEVAAVTEPTEATGAPSIPPPKTPVSEPQAETVTDSSTITASQPVELQDASPAEAVIVEQQGATTRKDRRKPILEPIQVPTPDYSDDENLLSDDSFMEELKSATVEEAKPISVGKSPLSPGYSNQVNTQAKPDAWRTSRAVSNPSAIGYQYPNAPASAGGRSISSQLSPAEPPTGPVLVAKKINVSSGISKRIKALEQLSSTRDGPAIPGQSVSTPTTASFEALRKRASVSYGNGNSDTSLSRHPSYAPEPFSRASSLRRPDSRASASAGRPTNSVSVTARIIRDSSTVSRNSNTDSAEPRALNLQASPLTVERGTPDESLSRNPTPDSTPNKTELRSMSISSAGSAKPPIAALPRSESRLSVSSRNDGYFLSRSPSETSASSPEEKKESRASRLLRRMSSITSGSRRSTIGSKSPAVKEEDSMLPVEEGPKKAVQLPATVDVGEVNVQFPDTLLWKRRFVRVDNKGYLVLTPGNTDSSNRNIVKRYHLTEFRTPCLPDEDRQELPNSILLDFLDGSTLQCACESKQGQALVLQTLVNAHTTHQQLV